MNLTNTLMFSLIIGVKHGFDPDHLAMINGVFSVRSTKEKISKWNGFMFSIGHGVAVTLIGLLISTIHSISIFKTDFFSFIEWIPTVLLVLTGIINLYFFNSNHQNDHSINKFRWLNRGASNSLLRMFFVGVIFALVFDSVSQINIWSLASTINESSGLILMIGLVFTIGMVISDTFSGVLFSLILNNTTRNRRLNFLQIFLSLIIVFTSLYYGITSFCEKIIGNYNWFSLINLLVIISILLIISIRFIFKKINLK
jgi:high-affinity nickel-transport protein